MQNFLLKIFNQLGAKVNNVEIIITLLKYYSLHSCVSAFLITAKHTFSLSLFLTNNDARAFVLQASSQIKFTSNCETHLLTTADPLTPSLSCRCNKVIYFHHAHFKINAYTPCMCTNLRTKRKKNTFSHSRPCNNNTTYIFCFFLINRLLCHCIAAREF